MLILNQNESENLIRKNWRRGGRRNVYEHNDLIPNI
jgi:hypothetical protein